MTDFTLDPRLTTDTLAICDLPLSRVLLMNDARWPWLMLIPRRAGVREILDLTIDDSAMLMKELRIAARAIQEEARPNKLNIGALGNIVSQFHIHVIGRNPDDDAWPGPAWGWESRNPTPPPKQQCERWEKALSRAALPKTG